jgi:vacuolar-type H+-ATPase subunit I/STV1
MRDRQEIEQEMYRARENLEANLAELKHVVQERLDVRARARVALERGKQQARDVFDRGKHEARDLAWRGKHEVSDLYGRVRDLVVARPVLVGAVLGGVALAIGLVYVARQHRRPWWD